LTAVSAALLFAADVFDLLQYTSPVNVAQSSPASQIFSSFTPPAPTTGAEPELRIDAIDFKSLLPELEMDAIDFKEPPPTCSPPGPRVPTWIAAAGGLRSPLPLSSVLN
jgi:hypothetical protein